MNNNSPAYPAGTKEGGRICRSVRRRQNLPVSYSSNFSNSEVVTPEAEKPKAKSPKQITDEAKAAKEAKANIDRVCGGLLGLKKLTFGGKNES